MRECLECGARAWWYGQCIMPGVDFDGSDAVFVMDKIECVNGHRYHLVNERKSVRLNG